MSNFESPPIALTPPPQRRAAPIAAWLMLTAAMGAMFAVITAGMTGAARPINEMLLGAALGAVLGLLIGGLSGSFDQARMRGSALGAVMGALTGLAAVMATAIPPERIDIAFHVSAIAGLCILAAGLM